MTPASTPEPRVSDADLAECIVEAQAFASKPYDDCEEVPYFGAAVFDLRDARARIAALEAERDAAVRELQMIQDLHKFSTPADPTGVRNGLRFKAIETERDENAADVMRLQGDVSELRTVAAELAAALRPLHRGNHVDPQDGTCEGCAALAAYDAAVVAQPAASEKPAAEGRCGNVSDQGLTCGLPEGHKGHHNALGWGVPLPGEKP